MANAVSKSEDGATATAIGALMMGNGSQLPVALGISRQP